jgi:hypothetical protein
MTTTILTILLQVNTALPEASALAPAKSSFAVEGLLVLVIIAVQVWLFVETRSRIAGFRRVLPNVNQFSINRVVVYDVLLKQTTPRSVLQNLANLTIDPAYIDPREPHTELTLLEAAQTTAPMERIRESINTYLIRNKGAVADFNLLRDITQRNLDTLEEEITIMLPLPLYLGLLGTMLGIVIGLFNMPTLNINSFANGEGANNLGGVNVLIDGVKYAMIASFAGLLATVINSWAYRGAKLQLENHKHDFFTFLQTELLPILTESVNAGIYDLNRSLSQFGTKFVDVADRLDRTVSRNYDALMAQQALLEKIETMDLSRIATFNVTVMNELNRSTASLERFATFLTTLTTLTDNTRQLVERTSNTADIADQIADLLTESQRLQRFLTSHFEQLEQRGQIINSAVVKLDEVVDKSLDELQRHIVERVDAVRKITIREDDLLLEAFERNRDVLKNLRFLEPLGRDVVSIGKQGQQNQESLRAEVQKLEWGLVQMNENLQQMNLTLSKMREREEQSFFARLGSRRS